MKNKLMTDEEFLKKYSDILGEDVISELKELRELYEEALGKEMTLAVAWLMDHDDFPSENLDESETEE